MSAMELVQVAAVLLVGLAIVGGILVLARKEAAAYAAVARQYGLAFSKEKQGTGLGNARQTSRLRGVVDGISVELVATYETRGRTRMRGTRLASDNPRGVPACAINVSGEPPKAEVHRVTTGDADFDGRRWLTSDTPTAVRFLLTDDVRTRLLACPQKDLLIAVDGGALVLAFGGTPSTREELQAPLDVLMALARAARR